MALICTGKTGSGQTLLAFACGGRLTVGIEEKCAENDSAPVCRVMKVCSNGSPHSCISLSPSGSLLTACTEDKTLSVWDTTNWQLKATREIPKRATALLCTSDDQHVLVADKTGEVWQYSLADPVLPGTHLLGHFSMLLDMVMPSCDSHVITCDRDEKIRVSKYPNSYNIESFCLGHKEFVSTLCLCEQYPHVLLSGSGDGSIKVWNWKEGTLLHTEQFSSVGEELPVVVQLACSHVHRDHPIVATIVENIPSVILYTLSSDGELSSRATNVSSSGQELWSCAFDWSDRLWVCQAQQTTPLQYYKINDKLELCSDEEDNPLLDLLCKADYFEGADKSTRTFTDLKKHTFDNMTDYLARKEERIKEQQEKRAKHEAMKGGKLTEDSTGDKCEDEPSSTSTCELTSGEAECTEHSSLDTQSSVGKGGESSNGSQPPEKKFKTDERTL